MGTEKRGIKFKPFKASLMIIDRDDAVLIRGDVDEPDFAPVTVELSMGMRPEDINTDKVVMLQSPDNEKLKFEFSSPAAWDASYPRLEAEGWMPIGFEMVRYYESVDEWRASVDD